MVLLRRRSSLLAAAAAALALLAGLSAVPDDRPVRYAVVAPPAYDAAIMSEVIEIEEQAKRADLVIVGRVSAAISRRSGGSIETEVSLRVESSIKGSAATDVRLRLPGGRSGDLALYAGGVPNFLPGERTLLFLQQRQGGVDLVQVYQSKYTLAGAEALQVESAKRLPIASVEARLSRALDKPVTLGADATVVGSDFVAIPNCNWPVSAQPVVVEVNPTSPGSGGPATGPAFMRSVYGALHAWQALGNSYVAFSAGGVTTARNGSDHFDGFNTVAWTNLAPGVLGQNWCATQNGVRIDSDTFLDNVDYTWDADDANGITPGQMSLQAVMEHEFGHGLGLDHTNVTPCNGSASTPLMCPVISAGVRKTILADDQAGAAALYSLSGSAPGAPANLQATPGAGSSSLSWTAASGSHFAYDIERSSAGCGGPFRSIQSVADGVLAYVDNDHGSGLPAGTYCYRVKALGQGGDSAYSNTAVPQVTPQYGVTWGAHTTPGSMAAAATVGADVSFTNAGTLTWQAGGANPVRLAYHWLAGACPGGATAVWDGLRTALPANVAQGGSVSSLAAQVRAPNTAGAHCLVYDLVREGTTWFSSQNASTLKLDVTVTAPPYGVSWGAHTTPASMTAGATSSPNLTFTNTGSLTWQAGGANPVRLAYHWRNGACPSGSVAVWDGVRTLLGGDVSPGGSVISLAAQVRAPNTAGGYCLVYDLVREGITWFSGQAASTLAVPVNVTAPTYAVTWGTHNTPGGMTASATSTTNVSFTNAGSLTWQAGGANPVHLSYHWRSGACPGGAVAVWDGRRAVLSGDVSPGSSVSSLAIDVLAPPTAGSYCLVYDLVREGITWFSSQGATTLNVAVTVS